jgi:hypothetical protein
MSYAAVDKSIFGHERPSLAPPSLPASRASGSTDHSFGKTTDTAFIHSPNNATFTQPDPPGADEIQPLEIEPPVDVPPYRGASYPTELK